MTWREIVEFAGCVVGGLVLLIFVVAPNVYLLAMMIHGAVEAFLQERRAERNRD
jgi:hypothetical protein